MKSTERAEALSANVKQQAVTDVLGLAAIPLLTLLPALVRLLHLTRANYSADPLRTPEPEAQSRIALVVR